MSMLIIEGDKRQLELIAKTQSGRAKRYGLKISLTEDKEGESNPPLDNEPKLTANEVAELIAKIESIEDLKQYESDGRQIVKSAYRKKLKELE